MGNSEPHGETWAKVDKTWLWASIHQNNQRFPMWCKIALSSLWNEIYVDPNSVKKSENAGAIIAGYQVYIGEQDHGDEN